MDEPATKKPKLETTEHANGSTNGTSVEVLPDLYHLKYSISNPNRDPVNAIRISPDGKRIATCSSDTTIRVYDFSNGELVCELKGHTKGVSDIAFSPINSNIIASCSDDLTIRLWSIDKNKCVKVLKKHTYHVTTIKFISKGNVLISGSADETVTIWDLSAGKSLKTLAAHSDPVSSIAITPDNTIIVSASYDGLMRLFDLESGQCLKTLVYNSASHGTATASTNDVVNFPISNVEITPNGKYILSSSLDGKIRLWDYMDNKVIKTYLGPEDGTRPISEKFSCSAKFITKTNPLLVVSGSDSSGLLFWDVQTKKIVHSIASYPSQESSHPSQQAPILNVEIFDHGKILASCDRNGEVNVYHLNPTYAQSNPASEANSLPDSPS